jgi:hypothetical protein
MRAVFLVGLNHQYQVGPNGIIPVDVPMEDFLTFRNFLRTVIKRLNILGVAEEMSRYALRTRHWVHGDSFPCELAKKIGLPHRYCNPDTEMPDSERERYWINELITFNISPVLFILGATHVESFNSLLIQSEFQPFVVERNWQPDKPGE